MESHIHRSNINGSSVPPGALISMVQKGMLYYYVDMTLRDEVSLTCCQLFLKV